MKKTMLGTDKSRPLPKKTAGKAGTFRRASRFEFSAGGVARDGDNVLMIRVKTLEGKEVWTFPKGHLEPGETAEQAAVREVEEETGYRCAIAAPLERVAYWFERDGILTKKSVTWFLMTPVEKTGAHDPEEILEACWVPLADVQARIRYKSDKKILGKLLGKA